MPPPFTFVHAADLHVASPFRGLGRAPPRVTEALEGSTFATFAALVDLCLQRQVDFLLVAGDVYDAADRSLRAQLVVRDGLARLAAAGIESFVVHGNHDPLDGGLTALAWPAAVHIFGAGLESVTAHARGEPVATVSGASFPTRKVTSNLAAHFRALGSELFHIGLLHCNVGADTGHEAYAPCELADLTRAAVDYWALGHVHRRRVLHRAPWVVYPGNPQGRGFHECGERGCQVVRVDDRGAVELEAVPLDAVRLAEVEVDWGAGAPAAAVGGAVGAGGGAAAAAAAGRPLVGRARLTGRGPLARELASTAAVADLVAVLRDQLASEEPLVWLAEVVVACRPELDLVRRRTGGDLVAQVLTVAEEWR